MDTTLKPDKKLIVLFNIEQYITEENIDLLSLQSEMYITFVYNKLVNNDKYYNCKTNYLYWKKQRYEQFA